MLQRFLLLLYVFLVSAATLGKGSNEFLRHRGTAGVGGRTTGFLYKRNYPKDLGPSNGKGLNLYSRVRVLKIASFEGPMILRVPWNHNDRFPFEEEFFDWLPCDVGGAMNGARDVFFE